MCSTPDMPEIQNVNTEPIATPTYADASVQKAGATTRDRAAAMANRNVKTSSVGILDEANTKKYTLGGGSASTDLGGTAQKKTRLGE